MMTHPDDFAAFAALVPSAPAWAVRWDAIWPLWPELARLDTCPQDKLHHAEGDVGTHTRMVVAALVADPEWRALSAADRALLFWTAVLHDVGKPATTQTEADGRITASNHSRVGAAIARGLLWHAGAPFAFREALCGLIVGHQLPFWLIERPDSARTAIASSWRCRGDLLCLHARADAAGRISVDRDRLLDNVALARVTFEEAGCLESPFHFANDESRVAFFERDDRDPAYAAHAELPCSVTVMSGLPGSGKDSWIAFNRPGLPVVSLDAIRQETGTAATDNQGRVIQAAYERAREHLRAGRDFVWNATNVSRQLRGKIVRLLRDYGALIEVIYVEVAPSTLFAQNAARTAAVPRAVILGLVGRLEPPLPEEAHRVHYAVPR